MAKSQQSLQTNNLTEIEAKALECGVDKNIYMSLTESLYPNAKHHSICMVIAYCAAKKIDPMLKPVHIVPMSVKTGKKDSEGKDTYEKRDVIMPGIGSYRIEASRSGQYAGMSEPEFGEDVTETIGKIKVTYPKWCKITVYKLLGDRIVEFTAKEFWKENFASKGKYDISPNDMWQKRAYGQLAKCTEAQALRKAFPDVVGQENTGEEMIGKTFDHEEDQKKPLVQLAQLPTPDIEKNIEFDQDKFDSMVYDMSICKTKDDLKIAFTKAWRNPMISSNQTAKDKLTNIKDKMLEAIDKKDNESFISEYDADTGEVSNETTV